MPSLNAPSPTLPGLGAGLFSVASNPLPSVTGDGPGDFAAMVVLPDAAPGLAPLEGPAAPDIVTYVDTVPTLPPGTGLPDERQNVAAPVAEAPAVEGDPAEPTILPEQEPHMGECQIETWDFQGASLRALARGTLQPAGRPAAAAPAGKTPGTFQPPVPADTVPVDAIPVDPLPPESDKDAPADDTPDAAADTAPPLPATPVTPTPVFTPIDWSRPPAPSKFDPKPADDTGAGSPAPAIEPLPVPAPLPGASAPVTAGATAKPGPEAISENQAPVDQAPAQASSQPQALQTQSGSQPAALRQPAPQGFTLPPDIAREVAQLVRATVRDNDEPASSIDTANSAAPTPSIAAAPVAAPLHRDFGVANRPVIDTSRAEWMQAMIERIAEMPQVDGKREAQITLRPDALGAVEVRIEQRQDRLHVTMNADNAQARQLLSESAPRLQELAEARGLRLSQSGVGGGESQDRQPQPERQEAGMPLTPRTATTAAESPDDSTGDLIA